MVSRMVLVAAVATLVCLAVQVQGAPSREGKFFFDIEKKEKETATATACPNGDTDCTPTNGYCKNFGGATGFRCVAKRDNGKKCSRPAMCTSGKCPSICLIYNNEKCIQKCEA